MFFVMFVIVMCNVITKWKYGYLFAILRACDNLFKGYPIEGGAYLKLVKGNALSSKLL